MPDIALTLRPSVAFSLSSPPAFFPPTFSLPAASLPAVSPPAASLPAFSLPQSLLPAVTSVAAPHDAASPVEAAATIPRDLTAYRGIPVRLLTTFGDGSIRARVLLAPQRPDRKSPIRRIVHVSFIARDLSRILLAPSALHGDCLLLSDLRDVARIVDHAPGYVLAIHLVSAGDRELLSGIL